MSQNTEKNTNLEIADEMTTRLKELRGLAIRIRIFVGRNGLLTYSDDPAIRPNKSVQE